jgi:hypothetical protein
MGTKIPKIWEQKLKKSGNKIQKRKFHKSENKNYKNLGTFLYPRTKLQKSEN